MRILKLLCLLTALVAGPVFGSCDFRFATAGQVFQIGLGSKFRFLISFSGTAAASYTKISLVLSAIDASSFLRSFYSPSFFSAGPASPAARLFRFSFADCQRTFF